MEECFLYVALQFGALDGFWWNSWCLLPTTISLFEEKKSFWRKNVVVKKALKCPSKSFKQAQLNAVLTSQQLQRLHGGGTTNSVTCTKHVVLEGDGEQLSVDFYVNKASKWLKKYFKFDFSNSKWLYCSNCYFRHLLSFNYLTYDRKLEIIESIWFSSVAPLLSGSLFICWEKTAAQFFSFHML